MARNTLLLVLLPVTLPKKPKTSIVPELVKLPAAVTPSDPASMLPPATLVTLVPALKEMSRAPNILPALLAQASVVTAMSLERASAPARLSNASAFTVILLTASR